MRIVKYALELDSDKRNVLVKENSTNCSEIDSLDEPYKIKILLNFVFHAGYKAEEYIWLIALNTKSKPVGIFELSHGTANSAVTSPREMFIRLCLCGAVNFVIAHNHPSGDPRPSKADKDLTNRIKQASDIMNINLLDHIIIANDFYYSFAEDSLI